MKTRILILFTLLATLEGFNNGLLTPGCGG
jgi:hypothetical protein